MKNLLLSLCLGLAAAAVDVAPMIARKLDKAFILSAAFMWIAMGLVIPNSRLVPIGWLNGIAVASLCVAPVICLVARLDREAIPIMIVSTLILGAAKGFAGGKLVR